MYHSFERRTRFLKTIGFLGLFYGLFLKTNIIFAKGVREFYRVIRPSGGKGVIWAKRF